MDERQAAELSLADFYFDESDDPLVPSPEYQQWRKAASWAMDMYHPKMLGAPAPRLRLERAGKQVSVVNLTSYNYMGFVTNTEVIKAAQDALTEYGTGACGSPLLSGQADLHRDLEQELAAFMNRQGVVLYNSGFGGAMGGLAGLLRKGDVALLDAKCHLSLIAGATLGHAKMQFFEHNDPQTLDALLTKYKNKRRVVVLEGIYSMDGDMADLPALLEVTDRHGVGVFIDEAHSILCCGENGRGVTEHYGVEPRVPMMFATFSKAFASVGGYVAGSAAATDYLKYYSHPYGFSCALPPSVVAGVRKVLQIVQRDPSIRQRLWDNTTYLRKGLLGLGLNLGDSTTQVMPIIVGSDRPLLYEMCNEMFQKGLFLAPVDYPSVPEDELRYRVAVSAAHSHSDLDEALQIIEDVIVRKILR